MALQFQDEVSHNKYGSQSTKKYEQFTFTEEEKKRFHDDPEYHLKFRKRIEAEFNTLADMFVMGSEVQKQVQEMMIQQMEARIGPGHEDLKAKLIPTWAPGCRRLTPGDGYLEALVRPNVQPVFGEIARLTNTAVEMVDGTQHEVDVLVSSNCSHLLLVDEVIYLTLLCFFCLRFVPLGSTHHLSGHFLSSAAMV